jgi:hypothetical protein
MADSLLQAIDDWVFTIPSLRPLLLTEDEWKTLGDIADILEVKIHRTSIIFD